MRKLLYLVMATVLLAGCAPAHGGTPKVAAEDENAVTPSPSPTTSATPTPLPTGTPTARSFAGGHRVGAIFSHDTSGTHFCTASTVDSPNHNLLITAAHCLHGGKGSDYTSDLVFVPGYHDGKAPYGVWKIRSLLVDTRWAHDSDEDLDVGFAVVAPLNGKNVGEVVGANTLSIDPGFRNVVRVTGYPMRSDKPITCVNATDKKGTHQLRFACNGYFPGTSGSPWLADYDPNTHSGRVVGVVGGYEEGGDVDAVSYSSYFSDDVKHLYDEAVRESASPQ